MFFKISEVDAHLIGEALECVSETHNTSVVKDAERIYEELQAQMQTQPTLSIEELSQQYGAYDLLTAYIMSNFKVTDAVAEDLLYGADQMLEQMINEKLEEEEEEEEEENEEE